MWPLVVCSILWLSLSLERAIVLYARRVNVASLLAQLEHSLSRGDVTEGIATASGARGPAARLALAALGESLQRVPRIEAAIALCLAGELPRLHRRIPLISSIGGIGTLFGLLGTLNGLTRGFGCFPTADATSRATALARGISESMNCTAGGLLVAICAMTTAELARQRATHLESELRYLAVGMTNLLVRHRERLRWNDARAELEGPSTYRDDLVHRRAA